MTFLHCADLHLGRRPVGGLGEFSQKRYQDHFTAFDRIIDAALAEKVDALLVAGDLFDRRELGPQVLQDAETRLLRLQEAGIMVITVEGNHDNITRGREEDSWINYLCGKKLLHRPLCTMVDDVCTFTPVVCGGVTFHGAGYPGAFVNEILAALAATLRPEGRDRTVLLVHTAIGGDSIFPGTVRRETIDLLRDRVRYIAAGHFHSYQHYPDREPFFFIPGAPEYWDLGEEGPRGAIHYDTATGNHRLIPAQPRRKLELALTSSGGDFETFQKDFLALLAAAGIRRDEDIVAVTITHARDYFLDASWCESACLEAGALKGVIRIRHAGRDTDSRQDPASSVEELETRLIGTWEALAPHAALVARSLADLKKYQQENLHDQFAETFDRMLETILGRDSLPSAQSVLPVQPAGPKKQPRKKGAAR